jgi:hypothetical protein
MPEHQPKGDPCQDSRRRRDPKGLVFTLGSRLVGFVPGMGSEAGDAVNCNFRLQLFPLRKVTFSPLGAFQAYDSTCFKPPERLLQHKACR